MKKSRLSLAAIAALGITTASLSAANNLIDIRLPDNAWKFVGVNGGFIETATTVTIPSSYSNFNETMDDNATTYSDSNETIGFLVIDHNASASEFTAAKFFYDPTNHTADDTYQKPKMYAYIDTNDNNTTPDIRITYQGDYEGETFYVLLGSNYYSGTYDSAASYDDNAQELTPYGVSTNANATEGNLSIDFVFDRNITNNPGHPAAKGSKNDFSYRSYHNDINGSDKLRIYHYNPVEQRWETYINSGGTVTSSDFTSLEKGKGYWVKYDVGSDGSDSNSFTHDDAGLILGDTGITSSDYNASELSAGWNMLSFNDSNLIATGATGMVVELNSSHADEADFNVSDSTGTENFHFLATYSMHNADTNKTKIVQQFNKQFAQAQAYGTLSKDFKSWSNVTWEFK